MPERTGRVGPGRREEGWWRRGQSSACRMEGGSCGTQPALCGLPLGRLPRGRSLPCSSAFSFIRQLRMSQVLFQPEDSRLLLLWSFGQIFTKRLLTGKAESKRTSSPVGGFPGGMGPTIPICSKPLRFQNSKSCA